MFGIGISPASADLSGQGAQLYDLVNQQNQTFQYDTMGNITFKSDVGNYVYGENNAGPHALTSTNGGLVNAQFTYDANGNQISGHGRNLTYSAYNKPVRIENNEGVNEFRYGPERQMIYQNETIAEQSKTTRYIGGMFEEVDLPDGTVEAVHHLSMAGHPVAVIKTQPVLATPTEQPIVNSLHYLHQDHLNSVVMITDETGDIVEKNHYDAFGKKRLAIVDLDSSQFYAAGFLPITDRSFTGHRYLPKQELIHMKGRVYDPTFGRFLSADPHIQAPMLSQSYNRYSYVVNNPLSLTDPSGYIFNFLKKLFKNILKIIKK